MKIEDDRGKKQLFKERKMNKMYNQRKRTWKNRNKEKESL